MNYWTKISYELANQRNYLDLLFRIYPTIPEDCREIDNERWCRIEHAYNNHCAKDLVSEFLNMDLYPIKDSYIAYLRNDKSAIDRNPATVQRIAGRLFQMGLNKLFERCSEPKETNRQIGPLFKRWLNSGELGIFPVQMDDFLKNNDNAILAASDYEMQNFAQEKFGYNRLKGLDFLARFNGKYVIGEAKFLTDFGGHQNAQFADAISTIECPCNVIKIAILDGVLYIPGHHKLFSHLNNNPQHNILSALVLKDFLYSI